MNPILLCIALLCSTSAICQKWTENYDKFSKRKTWTTEQYKIKGKSIVDKDRLEIHLFRDTINVYGVFSFNTSFEYEYLASKDTHITFLYQNDSTATVGVEYGKSVLMNASLNMFANAYSGAFYSVYIVFAANFLKEPIKGIRMHLEEYNKDFELNTKEMDALIAYIRKSFELTP